LNVNNYLENPEKLFKGKFFNGPEHFLEKDGLFYTGLRNGKVVEINKNGDVRDLGQFGEYCCKFKVH
jgi:hypothetical protein